jgi:secreted trypsin-like serine protease
MTIERVVISGESLPITECHPHPRYERDRAEHDIALCRLASPAPVPPIPLEESDGLLSIGPVQMVGYGQTAALAHQRPERRVVSTSVSAVRNGTIEVGDAEHTACRGDSGGPVLASHDGSHRVTGIVHGPSGAICLSSTLAVPIAAHRDWLIEQHAYGGAGRRPLGSWSVGILIIGILACVVCCSLLVWRKARAPRSAALRH